MPTLSLRYILNTMPLLRKLLPIISNSNIRLHLACIPPLSNLPTGWLHQYNNNVHTLTTWATQSSKTVLQHLLQPNQHHQLMVLHQIIQNTMSIIMDILILIGRQKKRPSGTTPVRPWWPIYLQTNGCLQWVHLSGNLVLQTTMLRWLLRLLNIRYV